MFVRSLVGRFLTQKIPIFPINTGQQLLCLKDKERSGNSTHISRTTCFVVYNVFKIVQLNTVNSCRLILNVYNIHIVKS